MSTRTDWRSSFLQLCGPGILAGIRPSDWIRLLRHGGVTVDALRFLRFMSITAQSLKTSLIARMERRRYEAAWNNVALHPLSVPFAGTVVFDSNGFAAGGADPYFTLFAGSGTAATVAGSNYDQAFSTGGDFLFTFNLAAGDYQVAMGVFANMSSAENWGSGTLADGFTFLGAPQYLGNYYYELGVTTPDTPQVPEPCALLLLGPGLVGLVGIRRKVRT